MAYFARLFAVALCGLLGALISNSAQAQTLTYVSSTGDDSNSCTSRGAPCKSLASAISKAAVNGEVMCLDEDYYPSLTITKSFTLDCGSTIDPIGDGITISVGPTDKVTLRKLRLDGTNRTYGQRGIRITGAGSVLIEDVKIFGFQNQAIADTRTSGGTLTVTNVTTYNNGGAGLGVATSGGVLKLLVDNFRSIDNGYGVALGTNTRANIKNSDLSNSATAGIDNEGATIVATSNTISNNDIGVLNNAGITRLKDNDITFSATAGLKNVSGYIVTYGGNRNDAATLGTITPAGSPTSDIGEQ